MASVHHDGGLGEACNTKVYMRNRYQKVQNHQRMHQQRPHKSPREPPRSQYSKATSKPSYSYESPRLANGGPGMQAIFIEPKQRSCGTGVFIPQNASTNFQPCKSKIKPGKRYMDQMSTKGYSYPYTTKKEHQACATVLLPTRVVDALNLNVHALGVQISPPQVHKYHPRIGAVHNSNSTKKKSGQKNASQQSSSPEIFLPKEWTY